MYVDEERFKRAFNDLFSSIQEKFSLTLDDHGAKLAALARQSQEARDAEQALPALVALVVAQAAELEDLRAEVLRLQALQHAVFGKLETIAQLRELAETHDVGSFSAELELSTAHEEQENGSFEESRESARGRERSASLEGKVSGILKLIAGIGGKHASELRDIERDLRRIEGSRADARQRRLRGRVKYEIKDVRRSRPA